MEPIRLFIADDHTLFRDGLRALFGSILDVEVVGEAATGDEMVAGPLPWCKEGVAWDLCSNDRVRVQELVSQNEHVIGGFFFRLHFEPRQPASDLRVAVLPARIA